MNIGMCGTGTVAGWCADTICQLGDPNIALYACATSPGFDCSEFAEKYAFQKVCGSFDELMADPEVDLVYIAVPNNFHYDMCMKAISYGKNVVCEKPFSVHAAECKKVLDAAHEKNVFVSEALWPSFLPSHKAVKDALANGEIGEVQSLEIRMMDNVMFLERVKHLKSGGGVLLDEGPYTLGAMCDYFGTDIESWESKTRKLDTGVDAEDELWIRYRDGRTAHIRQAMDTAEEDHEQYVEILGTDGRIRLDAVANPKEITVFSPDGSIRRKIEVPEQITFRGFPPVCGYEYEWQGYAAALTEGKKECDEIPNKVTQLIADIIDDVLAKAEIVFPF